MFYENKKQETTEIDSAPVCRPPYWFRHAVMFSISSALLHGQQHLGLGLTTGISKVTNYTKRGAKVICAVNYTSPRSTPLDVDASLITDWRLTLHPTEHIGRALFHPNDVNVG
ncbi:hypothetical protein AAG570_011302 [Ranatra chinensis]|uniref:Uncharacterized protein n=1 Tax=Ranatra chinensis TaxID=642074 RepID=A0ABD0YMD5_9HEMI